MKKFYVSNLLLIFLFLISCEEDSNTSFTDTVTIRTYPLNMEDNEVEALEGDIKSLRIEEFIFLFQNVSIENERDTFSYPTGYALYVSEFSYRSGLNLNMAIIPDGIYNSMRFNLHRLTDYQVRELEDLTKEEKAVYDPLVTDERYSIIIKGSYRIGGNRKSFSFESNVESEVTVYLESDSYFKYKEANLLDLYPSASSIFIENGNIIEPIESNRAKIEERLKTGFKGRLR